MYQADLVAFFERGQPLAHVISDGDECSTSGSSEEEDEEEDTSDDTATTEQSFRRNGPFEEHSSPSKEQVCLQRSESLPREADNSTTSTSSTCVRLKAQSGDGERAGQGKTEELRYEKHVSVSKSRGTPATPEDATHESQQSLASNMERTRSAHMSQQPA